MDVIAEARRVSKSYGRLAALKDVSLSVRQGNIFGLVGDNGAGKSTLFKLFAGLAFANEGEVSLFGECLQRDFGQRWRRMGAIIEQPGFFPGLSVEKNLECYRIQKGVPGKDAVSKALDTVGLVHAKSRKAKTLSTGMKQRLGLALALLGEPELLILDEPINGLDPSGIIEMRNLFLRLNREKNTTIVLSSHNLAELEQLATVYAFMDKGVLLEQITAKELEERCSDFIDIAVSDPEQYTVFLERRFGNIGYQVLPDKTIRLLNPQQSTDAFSGLASEQGMQIYKLERRRMSLERYYVELKEKGAA
ncbi:MAG: ABC transporter ATP-binding protein [Coriobacteriales bacterium]|jgi:ABC-2 type transport system ATP-binding protein|nr:ABC transporter ATP-binding protein [Coriobacteriales bacterium]